MRAGRVPEDSDYSAGGIDSTRTDQVARERRHVAPPCGCVRFSADHGLLIEHFEQVPLGMAAPTEPAEKSSRNLNAPHTAFAAAINLDLAAFMSFMSSNAD
jgi:hypothetical protein